MPDAVTSTDVDSQYVELLPARTVLSLFSLDSTGANGAAGSNSTGNSAVNVLGVRIPLTMPTVGT
jgi:hypothetical protein